MKGENEAFLAAAVPSRGRWAGRPAGRFITLS